MQFVCPHIFLVKSATVLFDTSMVVLYYCFRKHLRRCRYPVIFIITDGPHSSVTKLFPKQLMISLDIHNISFNPVAHTSLMKLAQTVMKAESVGGDGGHGRFMAPDKSVVEALVASINDITVELTAFACLKSDHVMFVSQITVV